MTLSAPDLSRVLLALALLLGAAHIGGSLFHMLRQPPVIGEILGGIVLGPTVCGAISPTLENSLFAGSASTKHVLGAFYELGLLLLVYLTGSHLACREAGRKRRTITIVGAVGLFVPFAAGFALAMLINTGPLSGVAGSPNSLALVVSMAVAVTSIPVIARIMADLGMLESAFARVVLTIAALEDILLYVVLTVIIGLAGAHSGSTTGLAAVFASISPAAAAIYFAVAPTVFMALFLWRGSRLFGWARRSRVNLIESRSPVAFRLLCLFCIAAACSTLGIDAIFGALVLGLCVGVGSATGGGSQAGLDRAHDTIEDIAGAVFIPIYFAVVGLQLDLAHHFDPWFLGWFLVLACAVKFSSVWLGARLAGEPTSFALPLAVAMNARGGPGIVLASAVYSAKVVSQDFFTSLVLLSLVTSYLAGLFLQRSLKNPDRQWLGEQSQALPVSITSAPHPKSTGTAA